jgi:LytS/YehU family sensor histidine kinase
MALFSPALSQFSLFCRISNFFGLSITEETVLVEMRIWCIKIDIVLALHAAIIS